MEPLAIGHRLLNALCRNVGTRRPEGSADSRRVGQALQGQASWQALQPIRNIEEQRKGAYKAFEKLRDYIGTEIVQQIEVAT